MKSPNSSTLLLLALAVSAASHTTVRACDMGGETGPNMPAPTFDTSSPLSTVSYERASCESLPNDSCGMYVAVMNSGQPYAPEAYPASPPSRPMSDPSNLDETTH